MNKTSNRFITKQKYRTGYSNKKLRNQVHFLISKSHEKSQISDTDIGGEIFLDIADDRANDL